MLRPTQEHGAEKLVNVVLQKSLAEIAEIVSGFGFPKHLQGKTVGELPFFKVGDISRVWSRGEKLLTHAEHYLARKEAEEIKAKVFPKGTVVFAKIGEAIKLNRRAILGQPSIVDNNVMGLIPRQGLVDTLYLYYHMLTVKLGDISQATTVPSVRKSDVGSIAFPLVPIEAQTRIVAEIEKQFSRLDEAVVNLKRVKANLKRYKAAVLKAAVEGKLTEAWRKQHPNVEPASQLLERILRERQAKWSGRGKYKESKKPDTSELPALPEKWTWATVDQLTSMVTSGSRGWGDYYSDTGPIFIRAQDIKTDSLKLENVARVRIPTNAEGTRTAVTNGDVLITITGANVTKSALVRRLSEQAFVSQHVALLKPCLVEASPYLFAWVVSPAHGRRTLERWAYGAGKPGLSLDQVRSLSVALPPLVEQEQIVAEAERRLSVIEELEAAVEANLTRADRLRQSILQKAFSGQLRTGKMY